jgi:hypothetical protein
MQVIEIVKLALLKSSCFTGTAARLAEVAPLYRAAIQQYRRLKSLLGRLERLSRTALAHRAKQVQSKCRN